MGNGNASPRSCGARASRTPNPSWGTGTPLAGRTQRRKSPLLTPHGERERDVAQYFLLSTACLLTPHGEREPSAGCARRASRPSPNPSWGTGTRDATRAATHTGALLTPHGEREPALNTVALHSQRTPNPSWGTGTPATTTNTSAPGKPPNPSWGTGTP